MIGQTIAGAARFPGTAGPLVRCKETSRLGVLSCAHVLAGSSLKTNIPAYTFGPRWHSRSVGKQIGVVGPSYLGPEGDGAVAFLDSSLSSPPSPLIYRTYDQLIGAKTPEVGDLLTKVGVTTGVTRGRIVDIGSHRILYSNGPLTMRVISLEVLPGEQTNASICAPGDSGSIWYDQDKKLAVGLHVSGDNHNKNNVLCARACLIEPLMAKLGVEIYTAN